METVLITGANRGLGEALAYQFGEAGYNLVLHSREPMAKYNGNVVHGDLNDMATILNLGTVALAKGVGILINNAGVYLNKTFTDITAAEFRRVVNCNLITPVLLTRACWPSFWARGGGLVVNINSLAGRAGSMGETAYSASKHGLAGFSKALQFDGTKDNVKVLDVEIGAMKTDMTKNRSDWDKLIDPFEVAKLVVDLCKDWKSLRITELAILRKTY